MPSLIEPGERNLLLNPAHPMYSVIGLTVERNPFKFDPGSPRSMRCRVTRDMPEAG